MLQARLFNYADAQRYRLGVNHNLIPVNQSRCPVFSNHRDGQMRTDDNYGSLPTTSPIALISGNNSHNLLSLLWLLMEQQIIGISVKTMTTTSASRGSISFDE